MRRFSEGKWKCFQLKKAFYTNGVIGARDIRTKRFYDNARRFIAIFDPGFFSFSFSHISQYDLQREKASAINFSSRRIKKHYHHLLFNSTHMNTHGLSRKVFPVFFCRKIAGKVFFCYFLSSALFLVLFPSLHVYCNNEVQKGLLKCFWLDDDESRKRSKIAETHQRVHFALNDEKWRWIWQKKGEKFCLLVCY